MGLLRTMTVLRVERGAGQAHHDPSAIAAPDRLAALGGSWNKRIRHLSSPVVYLTALLA